MAELRAGRHRRRRRTEGGAAGSRGAGEGSSVVCLV
jgi:hypothetical protein